MLIVQCRLRHNRIQRETWRSSWRDGRTEIPNSLSRLVSFWPCIKRLQHILYVTCINWRHWGRMAFTADVQDGMSVRKLRYGSIFTSLYRSICPNVVRTIPVYSTHPNLCTGRLDKRPYCGSLNVGNPHSFPIELSRFLPLTEATVLHFLQPFGLPLM